MDRKRFQERWNQIERRHRAFERLVIGFIILVLVLIVLGWIAYGFIAYKLMESPELIGEWINRFLEGVKYSDYDG